MPFEDQDQSLVPPVNPRAFDAGANPVGAGNQPPPPMIAPSGGASQAASAPTQAPTQAPVRPMIDPAQAATVAHHASIGAAFRSIMGNQVEYKQDPTTGAMTQTSVPQKPGQLWRSMLAGVLLGGQTAAREHAPGFIQGAAEGGGAVVADAERKDLQKRELARQEGADQRAARSASTEEDMRRAQIAFHNAQTLKENQDMQFSYEKHAKEEAEYKVKWPLENLKLHNEAASLGSVQIKPFVDADPKLLRFKDVSESDMHDLMKNNPDVQHLMWEPTGVKMSADKDGNPGYEATYSAVDPKGTVKLTTAWIDAAKKAGLDQVYGANTWDVLTANKELDAKTYLAANQKVQELVNQRTATKKQQFDEDKENATVQELRARTADMYADAKLKNMKADEEKTTGSGLTKLGSSNGDVKAANLSIRERSALGKFYLGELNGARGVYSAAVTNGQQAVASEQYQKILGIQSIIDQLNVPFAKAANQNVTPIGQLSAPVKEKLTDYGDLMKQDNVAPNSTDAYEYLMKQKPSNPDEAQARDEAIKRLAVMPWQVVTDKAVKDGITRNKAAQVLKQHGFKLEYDSDEDKTKADEELRLKMMEGSNLVP